jgi:hypothetical protein
MEIKLDTQPFEQPNHRSARLRVESVVVAGNKKRSAHVKNLSLFSKPAIAEVSRFECL